MHIDIDALTIDTPDTDRLATFYEQLLGWVRTYEDEGEVMIASADGEGFPILFIEVDDPKSSKNRLHFDLRPDDQDAAVAHALRLGAQHTDVGQHADPDTTWVVLADPDGNEFCLLRSSGDVDIEEAALIAEGGVAVSPRLGLPADDLVGGGLGGVGLAGSGLGTDDEFDDEDWEEDDEGEDDEGDEWSDEGEE